MKISRKRFLFLAVAVGMLFSLALIPASARGFTTFGPYGDSSRYTGGLFPGLTSASASTSSSWSYVSAKAYVEIKYDDGTISSGGNSVGNGPGMVSATAYVSLIGGREVDRYAALHTATDSSGTHEKSNFSY